MVPNAPRIELAALPGGNTSGRFGASVRRRCEMSKGCTNGKERFYTGLRLAGICDRMQPMTKRLAWSCWLFALCSGLLAQAPEHLEFEAAVIKRNLTGSSFDLTVLPGQIKAINMPMTAIFEFAFDITDKANWKGAPDWFAAERYDVIAKGPGKSADDVRLMLQSLLRNELKLTVHIEPRTLSVYALTVKNGGVGLQEAAGKGPAACTAIIEEAERNVRSAGQHRACKNMGMQDLMKYLARVAHPDLDKPIVDQTGLTGTYDFRLDWVALNNVDTVGGLTIFGAVEKIGLKLEVKKLPVPVLVIDHVERPPAN